MSHNWTAGRTLLFMIAMLLLLSTAGLLSCARNPVSGMPEIMLVSVEQEKKLGAEEAKKVQTHMGLLDDPRLVGYLDAVGQRLAKESPRRDIIHRFQVADDVDPNAFALPGGYVYVTRGLLALVNSEDELAGVVGHEIGHIAARHSVQTVSKQGPFALVFGIVSGVTGLVSPLVGNLIGGIGDFTQSLIFSPYSRHQETQADQIGQDLAAKAGWDPAALSTFLTTLEREVELTTKGPRRHSFFDSHPATPDRVEKTREHARTVKWAHRDPISPSREAFLAHLDGLVVGQRAANGIIQGRTFLHPDNDFLLEFPENWDIENSPQQVVAAAAKENAAIAVTVVAKGNDPLDGARALEQSLKSPVVERTYSLSINGLSAAQTYLDAERKLGIDLTWIAHGGLIYQIAGIAPADRFPALRPNFTATAHSFRPLSTAERAAVTEKRIHLVGTMAGETPAALAARTRSSWTKEELAVANGVPVERPLEEGRLMKVVLEEPYQYRTP